MTERPEISVVTPSFRNSQWLKLCVASVADQGVSYEQIVQDAASDDGTLDWLPHDKRVRAFIEKDSGMYDALNRGLAKASGEILAYLNCDEQYLPGSLAAVIDFFSRHPRVEVLFAYTVAVDQHGRYLFHRKVQVPLLYHTWTHPLSVLTCATFFRRSVIEKRNLLFDTSYKSAGDGDWVLRLLRAEVPMAVLPRFTSAFTITGANLSAGDIAKPEMGRLASSAPAWAQRLRPAILAHHRLRRWMGGIYRQKPFRYAIYTRSSPATRVLFDVTKPTARWKW